MVLPVLQQVKSSAVLFASAHSMVKSKPLPGSIGGTWLDAACALSCPLNRLSAQQILSSRLFPILHAGMEFSAPHRSCRHHSSMGHHHVLAITISKVHPHHSAPPLPVRLTLQIKPAAPHTAVCHQQGLSCSHPVLLNLLLLPLSPLLSFTHF